MLRVEKSWHKYLGQSGILEIQVKDKRERRPLGCRSLFIWCLGNEDPAMKKARMTRSKPAESRRTCWSKGPEYANEEDVREKARNEIVNALPALTAVLLQKACEGSVAHMKLLIQLERDLDKPGPDEPRGKNLEQILMEQWAKYAQNEGVG